MVFAFIVACVVGIIIGWLGHGFAGRSDGSNGRCCESRRDWPKLGKFQPSKKFPDGYAERFWFI